MISCYISLLNSALRACQSTSSSSQQGYLNKSQVEYEFHYSQLKRICGQSFFIIDLVNYMCNCWSVVTDLVNNV